MRVCFTPSARCQLLDLLLVERQSDRAGAWHLLDEVDRTLRATADAAAAEEDDGSSPADVDTAVTAGRSGHRFYTRVRGEALWVLAVWPEVGSAAERSAVAVPERDSIRPR